MSVLLYFDHAHTTPGQRQEEKRKEGQEVETKETGLIKLEQQQRKRRQVDVAKKIPAKKKLHKLPSPLLLNYAI
jgi:hypothetical protein